jgi:thymidylate synthase
MNKLDKTYTDLLQDILDNGYTKSDRTGTGTISVFGRQIRHNMKDGFPLLTTKKMPFKTIVTELLWFLRGDTNIKYLVDKGCHIWDGDAYKFFKNSFPIKKSNPPKDYINEDGQLLSQEEFINKIKTDDEFAKEWGELGPIYGKQWRSWCGYEKVPSGWNHGAITHYKEVPKCDQIANLINDLKTNPDSRRLMVSAWNVGEIDSMVLPPCHYGFQVYTRELSLDERCKLANFAPFDDRFPNGDCFKWDEHTINIAEDWLRQHHTNIPTRAISLMWNQRSVDTFLGLPFNIASYGLLLEIIAKEVNMVPDELIGNLGDTHLYLNHIEQAKEQIGRKFTEEEIQEHLMQSGMDALMIDARARYIDNLPKKTREPYPLPKLMICGDMRRTDGFTVPFDELDYSLLKLIDYQSHPTIKAPLSN